MRREAIGTQHTLNALLVLLEESGETTLFTLFLNGNQLLLASLSELQYLVLRGGLAPNGEESNGIGLAHSAELRVASPYIALPVGVVGNVTRGHGYGVIIRQRGQRAWSRETVLRVQGDTGRAVGVDSEQATNALPDTGGLDRVFLSPQSDLFRSHGHLQNLAYLVDGDDIGCRLGGVQDSASHDEKTLTCSFGVSLCVLA